MRVGLLPCFEPGPEPVERIHVVTPEVIAPLHSSNLLILCVCAGRYLMELGRELFTCSASQGLLDESAGILTRRPGKPCGLDGGLTGGADNDFDDFGQVAPPKI
jgi:hypothetical protein